MRSAAAVAIGAVLLAASASIVALVQPPTHLRPAPGPFPTAPRADRVSKALANGVTLVAERQAGVPLASVSLVAHVGWGDAPDYSQGPRAAAVLAAELTRHASSADPASVGRAFRNLGASVTIAAEDAAVTVGARGPASSLDSLLAALARLVSLEPGGDESGAASALADQQRGRTGQVPWNRADQEVRRLLFGTRASRGADDGVAPPGTARPASLPTLGPQDAVVIVVGAVDPQQALRACTERFASWTRPEAAPRPEVGRPAPAGARVVFVDWPGSGQATVAIGAQGPPVGDPRGAAFETLNGVYGGYTDSRLFRLLVQDKGWSYGPLSQVRSVVGHTYFLARADSRNQTVPDVAREMVALLDQLAVDAVPETELREAATYLAGSWLLQRATAAGRLAQLTNAARAGMPLEALDATPSRLADVKADAVRALARESIGANRRVIVVIGDHSRLGNRLAFLGEMQVVNAARRP